MREMPGMVYTGEMISHSMVNNGAPIPLYSLVAPEGKPGIDTPEGWNAAAMSANQCSFREIHGRDPVDDLELKQWLEQWTRGLMR